MALAMTSQVNLKTSTSSTLPQEARKQVQYLRMLTDMCMALRCREHCD